MGNLHFKALGILVGILGFLFFVIFAIIGYQHSMWYEMWCCIGGCVMSYICGNILYSIGK